MSRAPQSRAYMATNYHDLVDMPFFVGKFDVDFGRFFLNSAMVAGLTVVGNVLSCLLAAYALGRLKFRLLDQTRAELLEVRCGAGELGRVMSGLPSIAARAVKVLEQFETMTREGLTLSPETIAAMGRTEGRKSRWRTLALWIIALTFIGILFAVRQL